MSKQPPRKKKLSTNKSHRDDNTSTNQNAPKTNSEEGESIIKAIPFYVMALANFSYAVLLSRLLPNFNDPLCFVALAIFLVPSIVTALLSWGIAKSKRYGTRLLLGLGVTLAPWLFSWYLFAFLLR